MPREIHVKQDALHRTILSAEKKITFPHHWRLLTKENLNEFWKMFLSEIELEAQSLPTLYEIMELEIEELDFMYYDECFDDCPQMALPEEMYMLNERRQFGRRC